MCLVSISPVGASITLGYLYSSNCVPQRPPKEGFNIEYKILFPAASMAAYYHMYSAMYRCQEKKIVVSFDAILSFFLAPTWQHTYGIMLLWIGAKKGKFSVSI